MLTRPLITSNSAHHRMWNGCSPSPQSIHLIFYPRWQGF